MKRNKYLTLFFLTWLLSAGLLSKAQTPLPCGNYKIDTAAFRSALQFEQEKKFSSSAVPTFVIRVYFHDGAFDDGSNPTATLDQINIELSSLVDDYAPDNICFLYAGLDYINNTSLDTNFNVNTDPSSDFDSYQVPGCINIFYLKKIKGTNPACGGTCGIGGVALGGVPGTYCLIASSNIEQGQTIAHEVGHCMGLLHTFEPANGYEDIDGSNSSTSADLISDTQADPFAFNDGNHSCYSSSGCTYNGTCTDPKGKANYSPPYSNLMAYWWTTGCYPVLSVTNGQYSRVSSFLATTPALIACESPSSVNLSNVSVSSGYYMVSAIGSLSTSNNVIITGTAKATLGGALVLLEPGFHATPSDGGLVFANTESCGVFGATLTADKNQAGISANENKINSLAAYPNPASSSVNLVFNLIHAEKNVVIKVYDMNMKLMKEMDLVNMNSGQHAEILNLSNLSSGVYSVIAQCEDLILRSEIVKTN
jgi:hypothetical protein